MPIVVTGDRVMRNDDDGNLVAGRVVGDGAIYLDIDETNPVTFTGTSRPVLIVDVGGELEIWPRDKAVVANEWIVSVNFRVGGGNTAEASDHVEKLLADAKLTHVVNVINGGHLDIDVEIAK